MMGLGLLKIIGEGLGLARALMDPDKKEKSFHVAMRKNARKALNVAEEIFDITDDFILGGIEEGKFKRMYRRLKREFNHLD